MTHKERIMAAINHTRPDKVPRSCICFDNGAEIMGSVNFSYEELLRMMGIDDRMPWRCVYRGPRIPGKDEWGTDAGTDYAAFRDYPLAFARNTGDLKNFVPPSASDWDFSGLPAAIKTYGGEYAVRGPYWVPLFCRMSSLIGMEECLVKLIEEPKLFEAILDMVFEYTYGLVEGYVAGCGDGIDILSLGDDFATQRGLMFNPALWRKYFKPRFKQLFDIGKKRGMPVWFHSCGDITDVLDDLLEAGMDVWETVQLHTLPITAEELKRRYGKDLTFFGGVSTQSMPFKTPDEIRLEARRCIEVLASDGTGYILGPDHHISPGITREQTLALFRADEDT